MIFRFSTIAFVALAVSHAAGALTLHVAPDGSDEAAGSEDAPLASLAVAVAKLRASGEADRELRLAPGKYPLEAPVKLGAEDSGRAGRPVRIVGSGYGVELSGFRPLERDRWLPVSDPADLKRIEDASVRSRMVQYQFEGKDRVRLGRLSRRGVDVNEQRDRPPAVFYIGPRRMTLARWPDHGAVTSTETLDPGPVLDVGGTASWKDFWSRGGRFRIADTRPTRWSEPNRAWVNGVFGHAADWSVNRVDSVSAGGDEIRLAYGEARGIGADPLRPPRFYFENVFEELDQPGEYYVDGERGLLFFLPTESGDAWREFARMAWSEDPLIEIEGANHVLIKDLRIGGTRGDAVVIRGARDVVIENVHIHSSVGDGVVVRDSREVRVSGLVAEDIGGRGMLLGGGDEKALHPSGHAVVASRFVNCGWWDRAGRAAVELVGVGHVLRDCEFAGLPQMAIEAKGNDFRIEGCWFHDTCRDFSDTGAIYFDLGESPQRRGTLIRGNLFQNIGVGSDAGSGGVYLDRGSMGVKVVDNIFHRVGEGKDGGAVSIRGGAHVLVEGNTFIDCPLPLRLEFWWATGGGAEFAQVREGWRELLSAEGTMSHRQRYPELQRFFEENRVRPDTNTFKNNHIANLRRGLVVEEGISVVGGPDERLQRSANRIEQRIPGVVFDERGRPVVPGWRPWRTAQIDPKN